ncbi:hypothetical protein FA95DRAFT_1567106 [Auriscalpium vulgare]|uniref:Uncharacterized protein n=1 Tax=Auriscalpium vulgare TaxID=40419 RepID=A0ACB8R616_9AGAM|nr:hypothetical protein FA95DRAFT_1567106 [Auriscalpium vulgare]
MFRKANEEEVLIHRGPYIVSTTDTIRHLGLQGRPLPNLDTSRYVLMPCICLRCQWYDGGLDGVPSDEREEAGMRDLLKQVKDDVIPLRTLPPGAKVVSLKELQGSMNPEAEPPTEPVPVSTKRCAQCGVTDQERKLSNCSVCREVKYCGRECQLKHWKKHKPDCRKKESNDVTARSVALPAEELDTCANCASHKPKGRKYCKCGEVMYCSDECAKGYWKSHKATCKPVTRLDIHSFYPLLACLVENSHKLKPPHKAFQKSILGTPVPGFPPGPTEFYDGWKSLPVILQKKPSRPLSRPFRPDANWWPEGVMPNSRTNLYDRIRREGYVLPVLTAVCLALLAEMYTEPAPAPRLRLGYLTAPVADFGICAGSVRVTSEDKLGYHDLDDDTSQHGQDPEDHYWIYFRTVRGEELILECSMYTFNMNVLVQTGPYVPKAYGAGMDKVVPAFFQEREVRHNAPALHSERRRRSVLRDAGLQEAVLRNQSEYAFTDADEDVLASFMQAIAGRDVNATERQLVVALTKEHMSTLRGVFENKEWERYPDRPDTALQGPANFINSDERADALMKKVEKQKKKERKKTGKGRPKHS